MAAVPVDPRLFPAGARLSGRRRLLVFVCLAAIVSLPGCGGCRKSTAKTPEELEAEETQRRAKLKKEERKPDFEPPRLTAEPCEPRPQGCWCKPGHWTATLLRAKANNFDFPGDLELRVVDARSEPVELKAMRYSVTGSRPIALPKGQEKTFESLLFVPPAVADARVHVRISDGRSGRMAAEASPLLGRMPPYQYYFVVLARLPQPYGYIRQLPSAGDPADLNQDTAGRDCQYYRVVLLEGDRPTALPAGGLLWTGIACLLWDDADPKMLRPEQQVALLDWLHWGGQLILSGPDTLDGLRGSFLESSLPVVLARDWPGTRKLKQEDLAPLSNRWTLPVGGKPGEPLMPTQPWPGVTLKLREGSEARFVPGTGELLAERRVGRGRVVVSAFPLSARELVNWRGFDGFFNACLLGREPRRFQVGSQGEIRVEWAGSGAPTDLWDARRVSKLRYFTRDVGRKPDAVAGEAISTPVFDPEPVTLPPDVGAWSDFNAVADAARATLQHAAQIEVPQARFVLWVVGAYLLVLVPLNWGLFRLLGRVEWAWIAAPLIAVLCTVIVVRLARLNIGFARAMSEITVAEVQGDHPRAHVTRYTALYTSLYTRYRFSFEDPGAQILPFPTSAGTDLSRVPRTRLTLRHGSEVRLDGFYVSSNSTSFTHSEQMVEMGGPIALVRARDGQYQVANCTNYALQGAGVLRKTGKESMDFAWIGTIAPGVTVPFTFRPAPADSPANSPAGGAPAWRLPGSGAPPAGGLDLTGLVKLAEAAAEFQDGEIRLVAWLDEEIPGQQVQPSAPQIRRATLVVAHLRYGQEPDPQPDANTFESVHRLPPRTYSDR